MSQLSIADRREKDLLETTLVPANGLCSVNLTTSKSQESKIEKENGQTALIWAVRNRNPELVRLLLLAGADADIENRKGQTAKNLALLASLEKEGRAVELIREALGCGAELEN